MSHLHTCAQNGAIIWEKVSLWSHVCLARSLPSMCSCVYTALCRGPAGARWRRSSHSARRLVSGPAREARRQKRLGPSATRCVRNPICRAEEARAVQSATSPSPRAPPPRSLTPPLLSPFGREEGARKGARGRGCGRV